MKNQILTFLLLPLLFLFFAVPSVSADTLTVDFEPSTYALGSVHAQDGWSSLGSIGSGCALYDHFVSSAFGTTGFGTQSLRMSNAITSGCFGDHTFSKSLTDEAGETTAEGGGLSGGTRQTYFEASWQFASTTPNNYQPGLSVVASPDRGDGARMSWVQMLDDVDGLKINFNEFISANVNFLQTTIASGLDRNVPHTVKITMEFVDGPENDVVKVYIDGALVHTGTSWEDYFRDYESSPTRTVDSILFRTGGIPAPATAGQGFVIDNLNLKSGPVVTPTPTVTEEPTQTPTPTLTETPTPTLTVTPTVTPPTTPVPLTDKDQCKNDGWKTFINPSFKNQGQCVSSVAKQR